MLLKRRCVVDATELEGKARIWPSAAMSPAWPHGILFGRSMRVAIMRILETGVSLSFPFF